MSVCTGAFQLARAGLLAGKSATTHHDFTDALAKEFPDVEVPARAALRREREDLRRPGGLTSGIDLALRVVERYYGRARRRADRRLHGVPEQGLDRLATEAASGRSDPIS